MKDFLLCIFNLLGQFENVNNNFDMSYNEDQTLDELRHRIQNLKEQRSYLMNDLINERK